MVTKTIITSVGLEMTHQATNVAQNITQTTTITQMEPAGNQYRRQPTQGQLAYTKSSYTPPDRTKSCITQS